MDGAVAADLWVGLGLIFAAAIDGIAVVRVYFILFTGRRHESVAHLAVTNAERVAILTLVGLILIGGLIPQPAIADRFLAAEHIIESRKP
jgi:NADH-quinone oxidoreductase subunit M